MANNIDELPDDIISHILSFLSVRDTLRARLSSPRWLNLPDFRSDIYLDRRSILGVKIADRFMHLWSGNRMDNLTFHFVVDDEHFGEMEDLIAKALRMKVERLHIYAESSSESSSESSDDDESSSESSSESSDDDESSSESSDDDEQRFVFPCTAIQQEYEPRLKSLTLKQCTPSFLDLGYTRWLSKLTRLCLMDVPLDHEKMNLIFSSATNLLELYLFVCGLRELRLDGQLPHLKKLEFSRNDMIEVKLNCPTLEVFSHSGKLLLLRFVHVPLLREAKIMFTDTNLCSVLFDDINVQAPSLEQLSITVYTKIRPILPNLARHRLKSLSVVLGRAYALLSVKHLLNACPSLEELKVQFSNKDSKNRRRGDWDQMKHHNLRKVKMRFSYKKSNLNGVRELAKNILVNAVALEEMEIVAPSKSYVIEDYRFLRILKDKVNPTAGFIVSHDSYLRP